MMVCEKAYSLDGCGRCYFSISDEKHISELDSKSILTTIITLLDKNRNSYISTRHAVVVCNGTIVTIVDTEVTEDEAIKTNRLSVSVLLLVWCNEQIQKDDVLRCMCAIRISAIISNIRTSDSTQNIIEMLQDIEKGVYCSIL